MDKRIVDHFVKLINHDLFLEVMALVETAMRKALLDKNKELIDDIVLLGGSTMIPRIQRLVTDYFHARKLKNINAGSIFHSQSSSS